MAKYPFLTQRSGSDNFYYKRSVPVELRAPGRPNQIWKSLRTPDRKSAQKAYAATHAQTELRFDQWRREDNQPVASAGTESVKPSATGPSTAPLTPALLRKMADRHYLNVYENDFNWRSDLWRKTRDNEEAFWSGDLIKHPLDDWQQCNGQSYSYYGLLMEEPVLDEVFLYCIYFARKERLQRLRRQYDLGELCAVEESAAELLSSQQLSLNDADRNRLLRKLLQIEIKSLEDMTAGNEATFDGIMSSQDGAADVKGQKPRASPGEIASVLAEKYINTTAREREWPTKTILRKRAEIREFLEICGDRPINTYCQEDGVKFKDVESALPIHRQKVPFKGLSLTEVAEKAAKLREAGQDLVYPSALTVNDKIGSVSLFFEWAKTRSADVVNPVTDQGIRVRKNKRQGKKVHPWTTDELNRMFSAPIYVGCQSETHWKQPGPNILRQSAKFWVPLIGLFSGMRLGEIIQLQFADIKELDGIRYFDVTPTTIDVDDEAADCDEAKSLKTSSSRRGIPVHRMLLNSGFEEFLDFRRQSGASRLFPEYERAKDDGSWSKQFSKHFKRFRESIGIKRRGVRFHSLRHNFEDALRNADVPKEVRDAIQGHSENGVSREYGSGYYLKTLNEAVQKITYEDVMLPMVQKS